MTTTQAIKPGDTLWYATFGFTVLGLGRPLQVTVTKVGKAKVRVRWPEGDESWVKPVNLHRPAGN